MSTANWSPDSWKNFPINQQPDWPKDPLDQTIGKISQLPPLVFAGEIRTLRDNLAACERGERFLLQGGDCAEDFSRCNAVPIRETLKVILQMAIVMTYAANKPVVKVGRIAGQYAKPRSKPFETIDGVELPSYRGDSVNGPEPTLDARQPNPDRLLQAYFHSTATLNLLRAYVHGGYADLHKVHVWNKEFLANSPQGRKYEKLASKIDDALSFMEACGLRELAQLKEVEFFTSHEALILEYEKALTRQDSLTGKWYDCSAHMVWIGDRTRQPDGAHVEFFRGINNPVGLKVGPTMAEDELIKMIDVLNPNNESGRLTLISRFGHDDVRKHLPKLVKRVKKEGRNVLWSCDPMHGNTFTASTGYKTRDFEHIANEIKEFFHIHRENDSIPGGIHFELTGADVTEVKGGAQKIDDHHLQERYLTNCDPRMNCQQSLEMAFQISDLLRS